MDMKETLQSMVGKEEPKNLIEMSGIEKIEASENLTNARDRIKGLLNWRNENQDLNPNCNELMNLMIDFNNSLSKEISSENPNLKNCDDLKGAFNVLYDNVINHALVEKGYADKTSNLYKMFEEVKGGFDAPKRINLEAKEYLQVLCGVNYFQRERLKAGEVVQPNDTEKYLINNSTDYDIPEDLKRITDNLKIDVVNPEKMIEKNVEVR